MIDKSTPLANVMTQEIIFVTPETVMTRVDEIFKSHNIHHIPVVEDDGKVVGMVSKTDFDRLRHGMTIFRTDNVEEYNKTLFSSLLAKEVMTTRLVTLLPEETIEVAFEIFRENLFHAIPIVTKNKKLVGIVTTFDMLNFAFKDDSMNLEGEM